MQSLTSTDFFAGALPEAALWGRVALWVGVAGFLGSLLLVFLHLRDLLSLKRGQLNPTQYRAPKWGPLNQSLGAFFADPIHTAPLSPDAAADYVIGRLEAHRDVSQSVFRYFSYAPLLFGLMGTILALRHLLVTTGDTLQQIQPHLAGVFAGTLGGIIGSLLSGIGALMLDRTALSTINRAQDFIHCHILPTFPERRIAVRIEDAVLALIAEKAGAVAESFGTAMQPVAARMAQIAERCGKAAEAATGAFSQAALALREAGDLGEASRNFKSGAHMIDSSAEQLSDATKQTAEVIVRVGELRASYLDLLKAISGAAEVLSVETKRVGAELTSQLMELKAHGEKMRANVEQFQLAVNALSTDLARRASADLTHLEAIRSHLEATTEALVAFREIAKESSNGLKILQDRVEAIGGAIVESVRQGASVGAGDLTAQVAARMDAASLLLERSANTLSSAVTSMQPENGKTIGLNSVEFKDGIREAMSEMKKASDEYRKLTAAVERLHTSFLEAMRSKKSDGFFRRLWR